MRCKTQSALGGGLVNTEPPGPAAALNKRPLIFPGAWYVCVLAWKLEIGGRLLSRVIFVRPLRQTLWRRTSVPHPHYQRLICGHLASLSVLTDSIDGRYMTADHPAVRPIAQWLIIFERLILLILSFSISMENKYLLCTCVNQRLSASLKNM